MLNIKFQPNIPSHSGEKVDFTDFAIVSTSCHAGPRSTVGMAPDS